jgi:hypothetical protein
VPKKETKLVQKILLNHFEDESFKEGRISTNIAQVTSLIYLLYVNSSNDVGPSPKKFD